MSVNAFRPAYTTQSGPSDPFLFSKLDASSHFDFDSFCAGQWSSSSSQSSTFFPESPDQFCPSSAPTSPQPSVNLELWPASIKQEPDYCSPLYHKEEYLIDCLDDLESYIVDHSQVNSPLFDFPSVIVDSTNEEIDFDRCYKDFLQLVDPESYQVKTEVVVVVKEEEEVFSIPSPAIQLGKRRPKRKVMEMDSDETASTSPSEASSSTRKKPRQMKQPAPQKKRLMKNAKAKKSPDAYSDLQNGHGGETSSRRASSITPTMFTSTSNSDSESMSPGGTRKTARSLKDRSPEAYSRRREKNNIAVRKSREKKRQEIKKFADEHMKLKREVDQMRTQNEKLRMLVSEVEEGILDKSKTELSAMIQKVKKQMDW